MSINFGQFPSPRLPLQGNDLVVGYQLIGSVPTLAQYTLTQMFVGVFPGGIVPVANGGTGLSAVPAGDLLVGTGTNPLALIAPGAAGQTLISQGAGVPPQFGNNPIITGGSIDGAPIGNTTPSNGSFTTLAASGAVTGAGFVARFASPGPIGNTVASTGSFTTLNSTGGSLNGSIGATTPGTGSFTTVSATGTFTPSQTAGIVGTTTNNNANSGSVGEYMTATTGPTALTSGTALSAATLSLTAGDWDVQSNVTYTPGGGATMQSCWGGISLTTNTLNANPGFATSLQVTHTANIGEIMTSPVVRISIAATTSVFAIALSSFPSGSCTATGFLRARRVR